MTSPTDTARRYFLAAPPRLECTRLGLILIEAVDDLRRALDEARSELAVERAMRRDGP